MAVGAAAAADASPRGAGRHRLYDCGSGGLDDFVGRLDGVLAADPARTASVALLVSKEGAEACIGRAKSGRFDVDGVPGRPGSGMLSIRLARRGEEPGRALVAWAPGSFAHLAITDEPRRFVERTLGPFIGSLYPAVSRAFLGAGDLYRMLEGLEGPAGGRVVAARTASRRRIGAAEAARRGAAGQGTRRGARGARRALETAVSYAKRPFREAFADAAAGGWWVTGVGFDLQGRGGGVAMSGRLSSSGRLGFRHAISPFYRGALPLAARLVDERTRLYSSRSRADNNGAVRPLAITLDRAMERVRGEYSALVRGMECMPHVTASVYHSVGYAHMSLVDYLDGSSFDVWAFSADRIIVAPQVRATHASVARLAGHIFEQFGDGSVADHK